MGEETPKENGPVTTAAVTNGDDHDRQGEAEADGGAASRLARRKSIRDQITGIGDLVLLDPLTEEALLTNLRRRYSNDEIYTYIGLVVISINPYKSLKAYSSDVVQEYRSRSVYETKPHIYAIADSAYRWLRDKHQNQCIIISGESGSGKTEASKIVMRYVASVCGKEKEVDRVMQMLLQSNPLLEAFGNAKTTRNDNSSRFGKYMEIEFNFKGEPLGGEITNYLLEKSRLVAQAEGERNFHIFYQLLASAAVSQLQGLRLKRELDAYHYLRGAGGVREESDINDKANFKDVELAMVAVGLKKPEMRAIFRLIAAVLILGNISFSSVERADEDEACELNGRQAVQDLGFLLEGDEAILEKALTEKTVDTLKEQVTVALSVEKAMFARDALAKALYGRMFNWLVHRVNNSIKVTAAGKRKSIGVLDIYGFEIFKLNSFEQFIINYCNEKLQQIFIELTLHSEQEEYEREGVKWEHIDYFNNVVVCDLIEKPNTGVLSILDDECLRPGEVSDMTFLHKMDQRCLKHEHYSSRASKQLHSDKTLPRNAFRIKHYAGNVAYCVDGFIDKNKDSLHRDLSRAMYSCDHLLLKLFFIEGDPENKSLKRAPTAGYQFKASVSELMKNLTSKNPNYIRCIKPNDLKKPNKFDDDLVLHQVRYLGLMENVRVRRAGYAFRQAYNLTLERFKMLAPKTWPMWKGPPRQGVVEIMKHLKITNKEYACGRSKIFIRNPKTVFDLEDQRRESLNRIATLIQTVYRGYVCRTRFLALRWATNIFASNWKCLLQQRQFLALRWAAVMFQSYYRGLVERRKYNAIIYGRKCEWAATIIHKYYLGWKVRKENRKKLRSVAGPILTRCARKWLRRRFLFNLRANLPSSSPTHQEWPPCSPLFRDASKLLKDLHHTWRCSLYRQNMEDNPRRKAIFLEKLVASKTFSGRKACYVASVGKPFVGDELRLANDSRWMTIAAATNDPLVVWSGTVMKIHRASGTCVPKVLAITSKAFLVLDPKTMKSTYRVSLLNLLAVSCSTLKDNIVVFHIKPGSEGDAAKKGDFLFQAPRVIELVTKVKRVAQDIQRAAFTVNISNQTEFRVKEQQVQLNFKPSPQRLDAPLCKRNGAKMEVLV
ncbi:unconventional myosin-Ia-like [Sycon ciliatum]|uniref:unconventional myosin-Ia-like n=1 Tax=Sycon ciliatum TaxID=27933 RepID=UPI0031F69F58